MSKQKASELGNGHAEPLSASLSPAPHALWAVRLRLLIGVSREGLAPTVKAYSRLIPVDGLVL